MLVCAHRLRKGTQSFGINIAKGMTYTNKPGVFIRAIAAGVCQATVEDRPLCVRVCVCACACACACACVRVRVRVRVCVLGMSSTGAGQKSGGLAPHTHTLPTLTSSSQALH